MGTEIGKVANEELDSMLFSSDVKLVVKSVEVDIDIKKLPDREEIERQINEFREIWERLKLSNAFETEIWNAELRLLGAEDTLAYVLARERGKKLDILDELPVEIQVIGINDDTRIVGLQGELFVEYGITIQYRAPFKKTFVIGLANGFLPGYAATAQAYAEGGYETGASLLTARSGEQLVEAAVKLLYETKV